jgi:Tfp pilus assembly protein FimT
MKAIRITSTAILCLLLGIAAPAYAQQDQHGENQDHPEQQQNKHQQAKPEAGHAQQQQRPDQKQQEPQHAQQQRQEQNNQQQHAKLQQQQDQHNQQQARQQRNNQQPQRTQDQQRVQQSAWQQHGSQHWDSDHRNWQQRGGYRGYRIPDDRYRGYFGPDHGFRISGLPFMVVGGYPRFQYEGYWISLVDPWPEYWGNDWYDNDDVYVNYVDNGYYLYNRRYPSAGVAVNISF